MLAERAQQLEYKKQEAEKQSKLKQAENELIRMTCETNERLQAESDRLQAEQVKEYREELKRQMEYTNEKRVSGRGFNYVICWWFFTRNWKRSSCSET
mgnify:FL=1